MNCEREFDVLDAVMSGRWPDGCDEDLRMHAHHCEICHDLIQVAHAVRTDHLEDLQHVTVPPSGVVWWKAQRRARQEAVTAARRTIAAVQTGTMAAAVIVVGQRVSTIRHADQIVVLEDGVVVGLGTHDELLESCATYREIVESQRQEGLDRCGMPVPAGRQRVPGDPVGDRMEPPAGEVGTAAVGEVPAVRQSHGEDHVAGLGERRVRRQVRRRPGVRLHVDVLGGEQIGRTLHGQ
mgnify:CR=1 FL=1